jgi:hypothetical protein
VQDRIRRRLEELQADGTLRVVYACESGSRAWGFPSADSDFDVRFLYVRPLSWYLAVLPRRDVIEDLIDLDLDLGGWDLRKALALLRRGNAPLIEWLSSPIVYHEDAAAVAPLRRLVEPALLPETVCHHYLAQARRLLAGLEEGEEARLKVYLYVLRALLAARWVIERGQAPPMNLWQLLDGVGSGPWPREEIDELAERKRVSTETDRISRLPDLETALHCEQDELLDRVPKNSSSLPPERFDEAFLEALRAVGELPPDGAGDR